MENRQKGILFVVSAPSGAGKSTLVRQVMSRVQEISLSVSCTTRDPRPGERDGTDYFFVPRTEFLARVDQGLFVEWAQVHGALYGTLRSNLAELENGKDLILEIDTQGARRIKEEVSDGVFIFVLPPSMEVLEERLRGRGEDSEKAVQARLLNAQKELDQASWYDYIVVNDEIERATGRLASIIIAERCKTTRFLETLGR